MRGAAVILLCAGLLWPSGGQAQLAEGLTGRFVVAFTTVDIEGPLQVEVRAEGDGIGLDLVLPGITPLAAQLVPTEQPRVYEEAAAARGLFGLFDDSGRADPLDGAPLIWARLTATSIIAYRLAIARDGGMALERIVLDSATEGVELQVERRVDARPPEQWRAVLERED